MMPPFRRALGALDSSFRFGTCGSSKASKPQQLVAAADHLHLLSILHSSGILHHSARWTPRERRFSRLVMRTPTRRLDFISAPQTPMWWLVLVFWCTINLNCARNAADLPVFRLVCCLGLAVPGSDVPSPHRVHGGVTAAQVPPEAAKKHVGAPLSPENVTIVKFRQN